MKTPSSVELTVNGIPEEHRHTLVADLQPVLGVDEAHLVFSASADAGPALIQLIGDALSWITPLNVATAYIVGPTLKAFSKGFGEELGKRVAQTLSDAAATQVRRVAAAIVRARGRNPRTDVVIGIPIPEHNWGTAITFTPADEQEVAAVLVSFVARVEAIETMMRKEVNAGHTPLGRAHLELEPDGSFIVRWMDQTGSKHERKIS